MPKTTKKTTHAPKAPPVVEVAPESDGTRWQGWYTPLWHAAIDCGIHNSKQEAQAAVVEQIRDFVRGVFDPVGHKVNVSLEWTDDDVSLAYGDDGSPQTTTLPVARVEAVK